MGQSRNENALENILGAENVLPEPMSRNEKILHAILGEQIDLEAPQSRIEELLLQIKEQGLGAEVVPLSVSANGTYKAPKGQAYSPVNVFVNTNYKFWAAIYRNDVVTDIYINTDETTEGYYDAIGGIFSYYSTLFGELNIYKTAESGNLYTYEMRQAESVIGTATLRKVGNKYTAVSVVWNTDHIVLTEPYTAKTDGGIGENPHMVDKGAMKIFSKAPLSYGHMTNN